LPLLVPQQPHLGAMLLHISHATAAGNYDRSEDILAFRRYHASVNAARAETAETAQRILEGRPA
jgi:hypothetical protein